MLPQIMRDGNSAKKNQHRHQRQQYQATSDVQDKINDRQDQRSETRRQRMYDPIIGIILLAFLGGANGQSTNASCSLSDDNKWMFNDAEESPCLVWSKVQSLCIPQTSYINVPPLLDQSYSYNLPDGRSWRCQCNSASYSLMSACALCQYPSTSLPSEDDWSANCQNYVNNGLGFGQSVVSIPAFAYHQWSGSTFTGNIAKTSTTTPTSQSYTTTLSRTFPTSSSSSSPSSSSSTTPSSSSKSESTSNSEDHKSVSWGPIIGGAAGSLVLLVVLILLIRWFMARNNSNSKDKTNTNDRIPYPYPYPYPYLYPYQGHGKEQSHDQDDSFLEMLNSTKPKTKTKAISISRPKSLSKNANAREKEREEMLKRRTAELMSDLSSFAQPRTTPVPFTPTTFSQQRADPPTPKVPPKSSKGSIRFTTDTDRPISTSSSLLQNSNERVLIPPRQRYSTIFSDSSSDSGVDGREGGMLSPQDFHQSESAFRTKSISPLPPAKLNEMKQRQSMVGSLSMDFSAPPSIISDSQRPISEVRTLPSLYEPVTGAREYRRSELRSQMFSPESHYPLTGKSKYPESQYSYSLDNYPAQETLLQKLKEHQTLSERGERDTETIGAALGSGKRGSYWGREDRWSGLSADTAGKNR
ncbi:uncharacterized protein L199_001634 [Kwoniella botswanensis]|uniref:uncharacterized protein n=1 Tax=Kwoniella botswanensis TaxID=1268659 RepID=UPI00315C5446